MVCVLQMVHKGDLMQYDLYQIDEDVYVLDSLCRLCVVGMDKDTCDATVEQYMDVAQRPTEYGDDCIDQVWEPIPDIEIEKGKMTKNGIYIDVGALV